LPFSTSTSVDASLHMLWGGRQSSCFTSAIVVPLTGASTTNERVPSPRELRTVNLIASGTTTGGVLLVGEGSCIQVDNNCDFKHSEGDGRGRTQCDQGMLDLDGRQRFIEEVGGGVVAAAAARSGVSHSHSHSSKTQNACDDRAEKSKLPGSAAH
jgi:hypothetical protein